MRKRWDELLDRVIDDHEGKLVEQQEPDFIEVLLSHQHEYGLTRDHLKAMLIVTIENSIENYNNSFVAI